ncbi:hypothetical protein [Rhizobium leguminosarum]|uniref:hypothetical protein n=1 Tax=Rhizobium leguminosarum TaxID=384 RepID=UPI001F1F5DC5|nr:hypothetical protein [Rhizobium leguminosarum]UIJ83146.1 hypothetical protein LZK78_32200 [Rhizobium leguminosarum]
MPLSWQINRIAAKKKYAGMLPPEMKKLKQLDDDVLRIQVSDRRSTTRQPVQNVRLKKIELGLVGRKPI